VSTLHQQDPEVYAAIQAEARRQEEDLELIASENYVSPAVLEALGTVLTNKYAEGLPGRRYYGGCEHVDDVERLARKRARELFNSDGANVQPHSGAQANAAVYLCAIEAGDTILGLDLTHGGHLTHGSPVNFSGRLYNAVHYGLDAQTGCLDMNRIRELALEHRPRLIVAGASAYPRVWDFEAFRSVADEVGAYLFADIAHVAGLVVTGHHPSPFPHCDFVSTTTHKTLRGPRGGLVMGRREHMKALNSAVFPGTQGGPLCHVIAAKAVAFGEAMKPEFSDYSQSVIDNAQSMAERLMERGIDLVTKGTDNHLMLLDLRESDMSGKDAEEALGRVGITVNKNTVPGEVRPPMVTSGVRIGTPAMTTRGCNTEDAANVADWIADVLEAPESTDVMERVKACVANWCESHPVYGNPGDA
jgi:glycine hydroxymethyltransferase